jgi:hypothetical protein
VVEILREKNTYLRREKRSNNAEIAQFYRHKNFLKEE